MKCPAQLEFGDAQSTFLFASIGREKNVGVEKI